MNSYTFSRNEESLRRLGDTLSARSRKIRAKRINVNLKVNVLAYVVEVIGGLIICCGSGASSGRMLYPIAAWYGLVVPSCYLVNNDDTKALILKHGWAPVLRNLFAKKKPREIASSSTTDEVEAQNCKQVEPRAPISGKRPGNKKRDKKAPTGDAIQGRYKSGANNLRITRSSIGVFHISGNIRNQPGSKTNPEILPLFQPRPVSYLGSHKTCRNADDVIVIDL